MLCLSAPRVFVIKFSCLVVRSYQREIVICLQVPKEIALWSHQQIETTGVSISACVTLTPRLWRQPFCPCFRISFEGFGPI